MSHLRAPRCRLCCCCCCWALCAHRNKRACATSDRCDDAAYNRSWSSVRFSLGLERVIVRNNARARPRAACHGNGIELCEFVCRRAHLLRDCRRPSRARALPDGFPRNCACVHAHAVRQFSGGLRRLRAGEPTSIAAGSGRDTGSRCETAIAMATATASAQSRIARARKTGQQSHTFWRRRNANELQLATCAATESWLLSAATAYPQAAALCCRRHRRR